jgi:hypothetical protein
MLQAKKILFIMKCHYETTFSTQKSLVGSLESIRIAEKDFNSLYLENCWESNAWK